MSCTYLVHHELESVLNIIIIIIIIRQQITYQGALTLRQLQNVCGGMLQCSKDGRCQRRWMSPARHSKTATTCKHTIQHANQRHQDSHDLKCCSQAITKAALPDSTPPSQRYSCSNSSFPRPRCRVGRNVNRSVLCRISWQSGTAEAALLNFNALSFVCLNQRFKPEQWSRFKLSFG